MGQFVLGMDYRVTHWSDWHSWWMSLFILSPWSVGKCECWRGERICSRVGGEAGHVAQCCGVLFYSSSSQHRPQTYSITSSPLSSHNKIKLVTIILCADKRENVITKHLSNLYSLPNIWGAAEIVATFEYFSCQPTESQTIIKELLYLIIRQYIHISCSYMSPCQYLDKN